MWVHKYIGVKKPKQTTLILRKEKRNVFPNSREVRTEFLGKKLGRESSTTCIRSRRNGDTKGIEKVLNEKDGSGNTIGHERGSRPWSQSVHSTDPMFCIPSRVKVPTREVQTRDP